MGQATVIGLLVAMAIAVGETAPLLLFVLLIIILGRVIISISWRPAE
jgi:ABC-type phosphate transport system permease subunit